MGKILDVQSFRYKILLTFKSHGLIAFIKVKNKKLVPSTSWEVIEFFIQRSSQMVVFALKHLHNMCLGMDSNHKPFLPM